MAKRPYNTKRERALRNENALLNEILNAYKHAVATWKTKAIAAQLSGSVEPLATMVIVGAGALEKYFGEAHPPAPAVVTGLQSEDV